MLHRAQKPQSEAVCQDVKGWENRTVQAEFCRSGKVEEFPTVLHRRRSATLPHVAPRVAFCGTGWHPCPKGLGNRLSGALWGNVQEDGSRDFEGVGEG